MANPNTKVIAGVYAIFLVDTPLVYVGESGDIRTRWRQHYRQWQWPNEAAYVIARQMPNSTVKKRSRTERALMRLLRRRGYWVLSLPVQSLGVLRFTPQELSSAGKRGASLLTREHRSAGAIIANSKRSPETYREIMNKARAGFPEDHHSVIGRRGGRAFWSRLTPEQRSQEAKRRYLVSQSKLSR